MPDRAAIAGLVLAGGLSSRMGGGVKGLLPLGGRSLIVHVLDRFAPQVGALALNANAPGLDGFGLPVLPDPVAGHPGPLAGVLAGLLWAADQPGVTHLASVPSDTPFLPRDLVARLLARQADTGAAGPVLARSATGPQPVVGLWPLALAPRLRAGLESGAARKVRLWAEEMGCVWCDVPTEDGRDPFLNVNTPDDLDAAERAL